MDIWVCSLSKAPELTAKIAPERVVSLLAPHDTFPTLDGYGDDRHHKVALHDITTPLSGMIAPDAKHVDAVLAFLSDWTPDAPLLVHCWAGISRSSATAFIAACLHNPHMDEVTLARSIREASPTAFPNARLVAFADAALGRGGRMRQAIEDIGRPDFPIDFVEAEPFRIKGLHPKAEEEA